MIFENRIKTILAIPSISKLKQASIYNRILIWALIILTVIFLIYFILWKLQLWNPLWSFIFLLFIPILLFSKAENKGIHLQKKKKWIKRALSSSSFEYQANSFIPELDFKKSQLLCNVSYHYTGNTLVFDRKKAFCLSNITLTDRVVKDAPEVAIFEGLLMKINNPTPIDGLILIKPKFDIAEGAVPNLIKKLFQRHMSSNVKRIYTKHQEFDEQFEVYSNTKDVLEVVFDADLIRKLLFLKKNLMEMLYEERELGKYLVFTKHHLLTNSPLEISITGDHIFMTIRNMSLFDFQLEEDMENAEKKSIAFLYLMEKMWR